MGTVGAVAAETAHPPHEGHWDNVEAQRKDISSCLARQEGTATLSWSSLTVTVTDVKGNERQILKGVDGYLEPNHMLAIMGPSGCGKTTLLDTLAGRLAKSARSSGDIRVNGHKSKLSFGRSAYVTQDDVLIGTLTVYETIMYSAKLRLPQRMPSEEKEKIVNDVISELGLESTRDTYIGTWHLRGISGGQRRRVSIGCELVTSPKLIFLDEPTSGLDSAAAYYVMAAVRRLAEHCRTVVSVIHQPSSEVFALFDKLCLLSDGYVVYYGAADRAADFFAEAGLGVPLNRNPADHFLHTINRDFLESEDVEANIQKLVKQFGSSRISAHVKDHVKALEAAPGDKYTSGTTQPNWLFQTSVLTVRTFLNNLRNVGVFWMRLAMYVMLCLAIGFVYFQLGDAWKDVFSRTALLFFVVAFLTFMSIAAFPAFTDDMKVFMRERLNGYYGVSTFTVANTLASLPFIFLIAVVSTVCVYWLADLRGGAGYVWFFIFDLFLSLTVVESLMMAIAPLVPNYLMGIAAGAGVMGLYMIVCGFFQPMQSMPKPIFRYPLSYMSYHTFSFIGFMRNEFEGTGGWGCPPGLDGVVPPNCPGLTGDMVLGYYEVMDINKWICMVILACMALFYRVLFFAALKWKEWKSIAGRRVVVRSQQQEGVAAAASFTRLEEALDDYRRAPPSVKQEVSSDVLAAVQQLADAGTLKKWGAVETPARRNVLQGELRMVGISNPEKIATISVRNDAAFLFAVVGTTSVAAVVLGQLPGDWGFFSAYLTGGIALAVLAVGSINPGLLQFAIDQFSQVFPDYKERVVRHEAAHFLTGYLLGVPVANYSLTLGKEHTDFAEAKLQKRLIEGTLAPEQVDQLSVVAMAGAASEAMKFDDVVGQNADMFDLQRIMQRQQPKLSDAQQQNQTRWAVYHAASLLRSHSAEYEALQAAMARGASVVECIKAIEAA